MAKPCWPKFKNSELHAYLKRITNIDYNPETGVGKEEFKKAAQELQQETLNDLHNVFHQAGVPNYKQPIEKAAAAEAPKESIPSVSDTFENREKIEDKLKEFGNDVYYHGSDDISFLNGKEDISTIGNTKNAESKYLNLSPKSGTAISYSIRQQKIGDKSGVAAFKLKGNGYEMMNSDIKSLKTNDDYETFYDNKKSQGYDYVKVPQDANDIVVLNNNAIEYVGKKFNNESLSEQSLPKEKKAPSVSKPVDFIDDMESKGFELDNGEYKRNGVGLNIKRETIAFVGSNGEVAFGQSKSPKDIVLNEIKINDESARGSGEASKALDDFLDSADKQGYTIYIEPTPIKKLANEKNLTKEQLVKWYEKRGFEKKNDAIWVRKPQSLPKEQINQQGNETPKSERDKSDQQSQLQAKEEIKPTATVNQTGEAANEKSIAEAGKELATRIRALKSKRDTLQANIFGVPIAIYDGAIEVIATAVENGSKLVDAIKKGMNSIEEKYRKNLDVERFSKHIEDLAAGKKPTIRTTGEIQKPPKPPKTEKVQSQDDETPQRKFTQRLLDDPNIDEAAKEQIRENLEYVRQRNSVSVAEAKRIIDDVGVEEAYHLVTTDLTLNGAVRTVIGETLIKKFNDLAVNADNEPERLHYIQRTVDTADYVAEQLGTIPGQIIQALSLYARLSPEAQLLSATKQARKDGNRRSKRQRNRVNDIGNKLQKANEETVNELTSSGKTKPSVEKVHRTTVQKGKDKIQAARDRRKKLLDKYKGGKGSGLTLTSGGLTPEGIEYVGGLIKTYIDEGIANVQVIAGHIIQHLKDAGAKISDDVEKNVSDIVSENVNRSIDRNVTKNLAELEKEVNRIVKEHYTVPSDQAESLKQKFITQINLEGDEAAQLEKDIQKEFEKIATRKKNDILFKEKAKFDKIQSGLEGSKKVEKKTLHEEIIKYSNLGAFDNDNFSKFLANKLGLGQLTPEEGKKITELAQKVQDAPEGSPKNDATQDLLSYRANLKGTNWGEVIQGVWYANILSGYGTHIKNIVSTFFNGASFFAAEALRSPRSIPILLAGAARGLKRGGVEAIHTIKTGRSPIHVSKVEIPGVLERQQFKGGLLNPYNWLKFVGRLMVAEDVLQFQALKEMRATQLAYREAAKTGSKNPFSKQTWKIINEKLLNTKERSEDAIDQAEEEGLKKGSVEWKRRVYELMELSRPIQMTEDAYGFAAKGTFNHATEGTLGALTNALSSIIDVPIGGIRPLRFVVPFTRILTNVVNTSLDFTPVGLVRAIRGKRGFESFERFHPTKGAYVELTDEERKQLVARASLGIGLTAAMYAMTKIPCKDGHNMIEITGGGTGNYQKDDQLKQTGWQPYSVRVCGGGYYSYKLTPMVFNLSLLGNMSDFEKYNPKASEASFMKKLMMASWETKSVMLDMTWVASTTQFMQHLSSDNPQQEMKGFFRQMENNAKQLIIPNVFTQASQRVQSLFNMPQKQADNVWERFIQDIPIARNSLNDKINALGDPITRDVDILYSSLKKDIVWDYLNEKGGWVTPANKNSMIVYDLNTETDRPITADEYYEFSKLRGSIIRQEIENLIAGGVTIETDNESISKTAYELDKDELKKVITKISAAATISAKAQLFGESEKEAKRIELNESINK